MYQQLGGIEDLTGTTEAGAKNEGLLGLLEGESNSGRPLVSAPNPDLPFADRGGSGSALPRPRVSRAG